MSKFDEMEQAMNEARSQLRLADRYANTMLTMLLGMLRMCNCYDLKRLKKELSAFNSRNGTWSNKGGRS